MSLKSMRAGVFSPDELDVESVYGVRAWRD